MPFLDAYPTIGSLVLMETDENGVDWITEDVVADSPAGTLSPQQKVRERGAWAGDSYSKPRPIVVSGTAIAPTPALAVAAYDNLVAAVSLSNQTYTLTEHGLARSCTVRRDGDVIHKWLNSTAFTWSFQVADLDGRMLGQTLTATTRLPSSSGGLTIPSGGLTIPSGGLTIPAIVANGQVELFNPGNEVGPVMLRIDGPCQGPQIAHVGSGLVLTFSSSLVLGAGEFLIVDMENHLALAQGQASRSRFITNRQWFGFEPGDNTFTFSATGYDSGALLTVMATQAWG
ncbi:hypothetical protein HII28_02205 [Planctomonas sp. JC2975]|uniref:hypothetical protein n=1 Tax=Planctomonas sp. JC2975 TaxID=2729626 RepID=UPI001474AEAB|nr:hypothetical protein [Planctomonas sp. JC2975]NNC10700.1 hypothetical protein [Planctomonas sp. JC2975]